MDIKFLLMIHDGDGNGCDGSHDGVFGHHDGDFIGFYVGDDGGGGETTTYLRKRMAEWVECPQIGNPSKKR